MPFLEQPFVRGLFIGFGSGVAATATVLFTFNRLVRRFPLMEFDPINDAELMGKEKPAKP